MTRVKHGVVDRYMKKHPLAPASVVVKETGCHAATVYNVRRRLGLPTRLSDQNDVLFDKIVSKKSEDKTASHVNAFLHEEVNALQQKLDFASTVNKALGAAAVVLAIVCLLPFVK
jgi:hypothetical protein